MKLLQHDIIIKIENNHLKTQIPNQNTCMMSNYSEKQLLVLKFFGYSLSKSKGIRQLSQLYFSSEINHRYVITDNLQIKKKRNNPLILT